MKPGSTRRPGLLIVFAMLAVITIALVSWDQKQEQHKVYAQAGHASDTVPQKKERKIRDLDAAIEELEALDIDQEMERAMKDVEKALKEINFQKIELDVQRALQEVNMEKVKADVDKALKEIDFKKIEQEVKESLAKIDYEKIQMELDKVKEIDMKEIQASMDKAQEELQKLRPQLDKDLGKAKADIEKAKTELKEMKTFVDGMENDGLINKKQGYTIQHNDGKLTINGKEASTETYQKYRSFLDKHKQFSIKKTDDDFDIHFD